MTLKYFFVCIFALAAGVAVMGSTPALAQGQGQVFVLESTAANVKAGTAIALTDRLNVPAGATVRVVLPSGKTQTIKGPYAGTAADLTQGQKPSEGVVAWLKTLVQTGGSNEKTPGATRSIRPAEPAVFSWTEVPTTADSTFCIEKGAKLQLRRTAAQATDRVTVLDLTTTTRGETEFAAGSPTAAWPASITPSADGSYVLLAPDNRPRRQLTLRVLDKLPGDDDVLAELAARDCKYQFDAWVRQKLAAGKKGA